MISKIIKIALMFLLCGIGHISAQSYNSDATHLANFVTRMYKNAPFEGVRIVQDYDNDYLLSVLSLIPETYGNNTSTMNRVASIKAMSQASRFFNGSNISDDLVIKTTENQNDRTLNIEQIETIKENSIGYVKSLELLTIFQESSGKQVFIYYTRLENLSER